MNIKYLTSMGYGLWAGEATTTSGIGSGSIELEYGWQIAVAPVRYGYWDSTTHQHIHDEVTVAKFKNYILDQITDIYGAGVVQVANTFTGDAQMFYSYVVGSTPESSPHNFLLCYDDGGNREITGFWIKITGGTAPYTISWGE